MNENFLDKIVSNCGGLSVFGTVNEPLFIAKDVAEVLEYRKAADMVKLVDPSETKKCVIMIDYIVKDKSKEPNSLPVFYAQNHEVLMITEFGLYEVLFRSTHAIAKSFKNKLKQHLKEMRLESIRKIQIELEDLKVKLNESESYMTVLGFMKRNSINKDDYSLTSVGRSLTKRSKELDIPVKKAIDERYGEINSYSVLILSEYFTKVNHV